MAKETALVLFASKYSFVPDGQTERVEGISVRYIVSDYLDDNDRRGFQVLKIGAQGLGLWKEFRNGPAIYDLSFRQVPNADGKVELRLTGAKFVAAVAWGDLLPDADVSSLPAAAD